VPAEFIKEVFLTMNRAPQHCFQVLTKRANRLAELAPRLKWSPNIWMGVTVEKANYLHRIDALRTVPATVRFLSMEPLLGPVSNMDLQNINWVIIGGESGPGARPMKPEWVIGIRDQCLKASVAFFFKQWGGVRKKSAGRELHGRVWSEMPVPASKIEARSQKSGVGIKAPGTPASRRPGLGMAAALILKAKPARRRRSQ
jgi:protein gp37